MMTATVDVVSATLRPLDPPVTGASGRRRRRSVSSAGESRGQPVTPAGEHILRTTSPRNATSPRPASGRGLVRDQARATRRGGGSEAGEPLRHAGLAVGGLVLVDD